MDQTELQKLIDKGVKVSIDVYGGKENRDRKKKQFQGFRDKINNAINKFKTREVVKDEKVNC